MSKVASALPALESLFELYSFHPLARCSRVDLIAGLLDPYNSDISVDVKGPVEAASFIQAGVDAGFIASYPNGSVRLTAAGARALTAYNVEAGNWSAR